jgi:hypothetical protein
MNFKNYFSFFIAAAHFIFSYLFLDNLFYSDLGISFTIYVFFEFLRKWGNELPIKEFILLIASSQWIVGANLSYSFGKVHHKYFMYVDEYTYMSYVVPGTIAFAIGLYTIRNQLKKNQLKASFKENSKKLKITAYVLILVGFTAGIINTFFHIDSIAFFMYLTNLLLYVGVGYLFFIFPTYKYHIFSFTTTIIFGLALKSGMFHDLLLITAFLSFFIMPKRATYILKISLILLGIFAMYTIQLVKSDYRKVVWKSNDVNPIEVFFNLAEEELVNVNENNASEDSKDLEEQNASTNNRLNQGWIISKVLQNVPKKKPFSHGTTVSEAIEASLVPRFLSPHKVGSEQSVINFKEITGLPLGKGTVMGLSIIAELYANYGIVGGWLAMLIYGLMLALIIKLIYVFLGNNSPIVLLWFILFFFQVVKAETDLMKILNFIVKSILFFLIIRYLFNVINLSLFSSFSQKLEKKDN